MLIRYFFIIITQLTFFSYFLHSFRAYYGFIVLPVVIYVGEHISYLFWGKWLRRHHTVVLFAIHSNPPRMPFQYGLYCSVYISGSGSQLLPKAEKLLPTLALVPDDKPHKYADTLSSHLPSVVPKSYSQTPVP